MKIPRWNFDKVKGSQEELFQFRQGIVLYRGGTIFGKCRPLHEAIIDHRRADAGGGFDLLLTDLTMPNMSGAELVGLAVWWEIAVFAIGVTLGVGVTWRDLRMTLNGAPVVAEWDPEAGRLTGFLRRPPDPGAYTTLPVTCPSASVVPRR